MESKSCFFGVAQLLKKNVHGGFVIDVIGYREGRKKKKTPKFHRTRNHQK